MNIDDVIETETPGYRLVETYEAKEGGQLRAKVIRAMNLTEHFTVCKLAGGGISISRRCEDSTCTKTANIITLLDENEVASIPIRCSLIIPQGI